MKNRKANMKSARAKKKKNNKNWPHSTWPSTKAT